MIMVAHQAHSLLRYEAFGDFPRMGPDADRVPQVDHTIETLLGERAECGVECRQVGMGIGDHREARTNHDFTDRSTRTDGSDMPAETVMPVSRPASSNEDDAQELRSPQEPPHRPVHRIRLVAGGRVARGMEPRAPVG